MTTPAPNIYIPQIAKSELETYSTMTVGLQGPSGSGKTAAALTFPNPIIALFEKPDFKGLLTLPHLTSVKPLILPFYSHEWLDENKFPKFNNPDTRSPMHDPAGAFKKWLDGTARQLTNQQTLVIDNWTRLQELFDKINWSYKTLTKDGLEDFREPWDRKLTFSEEIMNPVVSLNCNIVVLFHEIQERDKKTGEVLDKIQPLQKGQFAVKLKSYFPNFFRQHCRENKDTKAIEYVWQVKGSSNFDAKCSKPNLPQFVPANYSSLLT